MHEQEERKGWWCNRVTSIRCHHHCRPGICGGGKTEKELLEDVNEKGVDNFLISNPANLTFLESLNFTASRFKTLSNIETNCKYKTITFWLNCNYILASKILMDKK